MVSTAFIQQTRLDDIHVLGTKDRAVKTDMVPALTQVTMQSG